MTDSGDENISIMDSDEEFIIGEQLMEELSSDYIESSEISLSEDESVQPTTTASRTRKRPRGQGSNAGETSSAKR